MIIKLYIILKLILIIIIYSNLKDRVNTHFAPRHLTTNNRRAPLPLSPISENPNHHYNYIPLQTQLINVVIKEFLNITNSTTNQWLLSWASASPLSSHSSSPLLLRRPSRRRSSRSAATTVGDTPPPTRPACTENGQKPGDSTSEILYVSSWFPHAKILTRFFQTLILFFLWKKKKGFVYKNDSVMVVDKYGYYHCNSTNPTSVFKDGNTVVNLERPGPAYFVSGDPGHCKDGQRLMVEVITLHPGSRSPPRPEEESPAPSPSGAASLPVVLPPRLLLFYLLAIAASVHIWVF